jgi:hypothetical protein
MSTETYALDAQLRLAGIDLDALRVAGVRFEVHGYDEFAGFLKCKTSIDDEARVVHIHEAVTERAADGTPLQVRVKCKSGESLVEHFPTREDASPFAQRRDVTGFDVIRAWLAQAVADVGDGDEAEEASARAAAVVVEQDSLAAAGQDWVQPTVTAWKDGDGVVHLQARTMFVASTHPLPAGFTPPPGVLGVHYATLPTPELIAQVVAGTADLPTVEVDAAPSYRT